MAIPGAGFTFGSCATAGRAKMVLHAKRVAKARPSVERVIPISLVVMPP
jgi:hypothetical protein